MSPIGVQEFCFWVLHCSGVVQPCHESLLLRVAHVADELRERSLNVKWEIEIDILIIFT
jgi:hypothetical protein